MSDEAIEARSNYRYRVWYDGNPGFPNKWRWEVQLAAVVDGGKADEITPLRYEMSPSEDVARYKAEEWIRNAADANVADAEARQGRKTARWVTVP